MGRFKLTFVQWIERIHLMYFVFVSTKYINTAELWCRDCITNKCLAGKHSPGFDVSYDRKSLVSMFLHVFVCAFDVLCLCEIKKGNYEYTIMNVCCVELLCVYMWVDILCVCLMKNFSLSIYIKLCVVCACVCTENCLGTPNAPLDSSLYIEI